MFSRSDTLIPYRPRSKLYSLTNVCFDPEKIEARSYEWWIFVKRVGQLNVFNSYPYSNTTRRHQRLMRTLLQELGVEIHATIEAPQGLQAIGSAVPVYERRIEALREAIARPRSQVKKNLERERDIKELTAKIRQVKALMRMESKREAVNA